MADEEDPDVQEIIINPVEQRTASSPLPISTPSVLGVSPLRSSASTVFSTSPRKPSRPSGHERIRLAQDVPQRQPSGSLTANPLALVLSRTTSALSATSPQGSLPSSMPATVPTSAALLDAEEGPARFQRSASVGNVLSPEVPNILAPHVTYGDLRPLKLRRAHSEVLDPIDRDQVTRRDTLALPVPNTAPVAPTRGRSHSAVSRNSGASGVISQSRALAHEVLQEEREQAIERRRAEDKKMMQKFANSRKAWRNWFMKAPDNQD